MALKRKSTIIALLVLLFVLPLVAPPLPFTTTGSNSNTLVGTAHANGESWLSGWSYRKSHVINSASGAGTDYQVQIITRYGSGTDSGNTVYLNNRSRTDFGDVRFTASDGSTVLSYWQEANYSISGLTKYGSNPILAAVSGQYAQVVYNGTKWNMYYAYGSPNKIGLATSTDGKSWTIDTAHNPVLDLGAGGKFDDGSVSVPVVWNESTTMYMLYTGTHSTTHTIGLAESTDGVTWTRQNSGNAVFAPSSGWDANDVEAASVMKVGSTYYLYFSCTSKTNVYAGGRGIGVATSTDLLSWTEDTASPIMGGGRFTPSGIIKRNGYYYLFINHYTRYDGQGIANVELWRDTSPTFYRSSRVFLGIAINYAASGWDSSLDTPFVMTDNVTRNSFSFTGNQLWVYYSSPTGGNGLTIDTNIDTALTGGTSYAKFWVKVSGDLGSAAQTIYVYYGNSGATSASSGGDTFPTAFNDFASAPSNLAEGAFQITRSTYLDTNGIGTGSGHYHGPRGNYTISNQTDFRIRYSAVSVATYAGEGREVVWLTDTAGHIVYYFLIGDPDTTSTQTYIRSYTNTTNTCTDFESYTPSCANRFLNLGSYPTWSDGEYQVEFIRVGSLVGLNYTTGLGNNASNNAYNGDQTTTTQIGYVMVGIQGDDAAALITKHQINWFFISKYVNPEPTHGAWGTEDVPVTITFALNGLSSDASGTVIAIDGTNYSYSDFPTAFSWAASSTHTVTATDPIVVTANQKQYTPSSWTNGDGLSGASGTYTTPASATTVTANYNTQYYLVVSSSYGSPTGQGWYNSGTSVSSTVTRPVSCGFDCRYETTGFTGTGSAPSSSTPHVATTGSFSLTQYSTVTWNWRPQYQPTIH